MWVKNHHSIEAVVVGSHLVAFLVDGRFLIDKLHIPAVHCLVKHWHAWCFSFVLHGLLIKELLTASATCIGVQV